MTLEEAIKHYEEVAKEQEIISNNITVQPVQENCTESADENRQLVVWLRELKELNEKKYGVWENQQYDEVLEYFTATCSSCGYISSDPFVIEGSHLTCERCGAKMKYKLKE